MRNTHLSKATWSLLAASAAGLLLLGSTVHAQAMKPAMKGDLSASEQKFLRTAAQGGMAEVKLGQLAVEKAASADVKSFGQRMVDDHGKANDKLKALASAKGVTLPTDVNAEQKAMDDKLAKLSGAAFDREYMKGMLADHKKDVAEFEKESSRAKDAEVKTFASTTLPTLKEHLKMAEEISAKTGGMKSGSMK